MRQLTAETVEKIQQIISGSVYQEAVTVLRKELGRPTLVKDYTSDFEEEYHSFLIKETDVDEWLTGLEITTKLINYYAQRYNRSVLSDKYINELNAWMTEDCFGYQIENLQIIQISNKFTHSEVVLPALELLSEKRFAGANSEFRQAHTEFRAGEYEDCIHDCCNAFESVLKVILDEKGWTYQPTDTAKKLLDVAFSNNLIPSHMQNSFAGLRAILESGIPTVRNKNAGHGTGATPRSIPNYIAAFQLHQTAAAILLLAEAAK